MAQLHWSPQPLVMTDFELRGILQQGCQACCCQPRIIPSSAEVVIVEQQKATGPWTCLTPVSLHVGMRLRAPGRVLLPRQRRHVQHRHAPS